MSSVQWGVIAESVRGASHYRKGLPNQDAFAIDDSGAGRAALIVALSDGHGCELSFRSQIGSQFAADIAVQLGREFAEEVEAGADVAALAAGAQDLAARIIESWKHRVTEHLAENPFQVDEFDKLEKRRGMAARKQFELGSETFLAYGATLVHLVLLPEAAVFLRLGDGEALTVHSESEPPVLRVFPSDPRQIGDVCSSLCEPNPIEHVAIDIQHFATATPSVILLCTDGYDKSFASEASFLQVGTDLVRMLQTEGVAALEACLTDHLQQVTTEGSGDDITVAIVWRRD